MGQGTALQVSGSPRLKCCCCPLPDKPGVTQHELHARALIAQGEGGGHGGGVKGEDGLVAGAAPHLRAGGDVSA